MTPEQESIRSDLHRLFDEHIREGHPGLPLLAVPLRYDHVLQAMRRRGEIAIVWVPGAERLGWSRYVKLRAA